MKKLLIITNLFWISIILLPSFIKKATSSITPGNYHLVDAGLVKMFATDYKNNYVNAQRRNGQLNTSNPYDSRTAWFGFDKLESFIADVKAQSKPDSMANGIRFYFMQYPELKDLNNSKYAYLGKIPKEYAGLHSLMMVPTYFNGTYDVDFDPRVSTRNPNGSYKSIDQVFEMFLSNENKAFDGTILNRQSLNNNANKPMIAIASGTSTLAYDDPNVVNGSGLVPPPPRKPGSTNMMVKSFGNDIPCHGATLMTHFDYSGKCGFRQFTISKKTGHLTQ
jgi:hypothetical protein